LAGFSLALAMLVRGLDHDFKPTKYQSATLIQVNLADVLAHIRNPWVSYDT